jgi:hypothetical protein
MEPPAELVDLEAMFGNIVAAALGLGGILLFIFLLYGGFKYITSGGDPQSAAAARQTITYAVIGFILAASAVLILNIIAYVTGQTGWANFIIFVNP